MFTFGPAAGEEFPAAPWRHLTIGVHRSDAFRLPPNIALAVELNMPT